MAPTYANLTMAFLEVQLYKKVLEKYGEDIHDYVKNHWKRFLDDGQLFWKKSFGPIQEFVDILNSLDTNIQFTHEWSETGLSFLNIFLYKEDGKLLTDVYYKSTDSHDYMPFNSCHPRHVKENNPKTLARIICTIVTDPKRKIYRLNELKIWLLKAGYPTSLINNGFSEILNIEQSVLRQKVTHPPENVLPFVQTHNPKNPHVYPHLLNAWNMLLSSEKYSKKFNGTRIIKSERQPKNLGAILQSSFFSTEKPLWGIKKCNRSNCGTCRHLREVDTAYFDQVNLNFKIMTPFTCDSGNLIYQIVCNGCNLYYIGSTGNLRSRVSGHKSDLKSAKMKVHRHITNCPGAHLLEVKFSIIPFYKCKKDNFASRIAVENYFRRKFKPQLNGY